MIPGIMVLDSLYDSGIPISQIDVNMILGIAYAFASTAKSQFCLSKRCAVEV